MRVPSIWQMIIPQQNTFRNTGKKFDIIKNDTSIAKKNAVRPACHVFRHKTANLCDFKTDMGILAVYAI